MGSVWVWIVGGALVLALFVLLRPRKAPTPRRVLQVRGRGDNYSDTGAWIATGAIGAGAAHNSSVSDRNDRDGAPGGAYLAGHGHEQGHSDSSSSSSDSGSSGGDSAGGGGGDGGGGGGD